MPRKEPIATLRFIGIMALVIVGLIARLGGRAIGDLLIAGAVLWLLIALVVEYKKTL